MTPKQIKRAKRLAEILKIPMVINMQTTCLNSRSHRQAEKAILFGSHYGCSSRKLVIPMNIPVLAKARENGIKELVLNTDYSQLEQRVRSSLA